jgi:hypothetical protein
MPDPSHDEKAAQLEKDAEKAQAAVTAAHMKAGDTYHAATREHTDSGNDSERDGDHAEAQKAFEKAAADPDKAAAEYQKAAGAGNPNGNDKAIREYQQAATARMQAAEAAQADGDDSAAAKLYGAAASSHESAALLSMVMDGSSALRSNTRSPRNTE